MSPRQRAAKKKKMDTTYEKVMTALLYSHYSGPEGGRGNPRLLG